MNVLKLLLTVWICSPQCIYARLRRNEGRILERRSPDTSSENYGSYGSSTSSSTIYGSPSYNQIPSSSSSYDSRPSASQYSNYGKTSHYGSWSDRYNHGDAFRVPITWVILLNLSTFSIAALITAQQFEHNPEGNFANLCRLCINTLDCFCRIIYNLYHCRLNEIPTVVSAEDDDDEYTEQELQNMKLRPGIGKALDVEHRKSMRKTTQKIQAMKAKQTAKKNGNSLNPNPKNTT
eukprot:scaffold5222_cov282-Chaetoceros_neogracile.AAC.24